MIKKICLTTRDGKRVVGCKIVVTSVFETDIENIWCKIQDIDTLREICKPKASFISYDDVPSVWKEGETFCFKLFLHRFIPIGKHTISIIKIDKKSREIVSNEYNKRVTIWNHYIQMEKIAENVTRYTDSIELHAGYLKSGRKLYNTSLKTIYRTLEVMLFTRYAEAFQQIA